MEAMDATMIGNVVILVMNRTVSDGRRSQLRAIVANIAICCPTCIKAIRGHIRNPLNMIINTKGIIGGNMGTNMIITMNNLNSLSPTRDIIIGGLEDGTRFCPGLFTT